LAVPHLRIQHPGEATADSAVAVTCGCTPRQDQSGRGSTPCTYHNTQARPERTWQYPLNVDLHRGKARADSAVPFNCSPTPKGIARADSVVPHSRGPAPRQHHTGHGSTKFTYHNIQASPERTRQYPLHVVLHPGKTRAVLEVPYSRITTPRQGQSRLGRIHKI
jgi:hypothetical protein